MSEALRTWKNKLDYLQQQEATVADPAQKFALAEQIKEAKAKIAELEATPNRILQDAPSVARSSKWLATLRVGASSLICASGIACLVWEKLRPRPLTADMTVIPTDWRVVVGILMLVGGGLGLLLPLLLRHATGQSKHLGNTRMAP